MKKKIENKNERKVELYTTFLFVHIENANNVALHLARGGYFVNMINEGGSYRVNIYQIV